MDSSRPFRSYSADRWGRNRDEIYSDQDDDLGVIVDSAIEEINLRADYQSAWQCREAFRELYQNWRDGIVHAFKVAERDLEIAIYDDKENREFLITARHHPTAHSSVTRIDGVLGYIKFTYDAYGKGILEMTNMKASLERAHLGLGASSKTNDKSQAGTHGEGLKLAALIMLRLPHNHSTVIRTNGFTWTFEFGKKKKLQCRLSRLRTTKINHGRTSLSADFHRDMCLCVGEELELRGSDGLKRATSRILLSDFQAWLSVVLDLTPPPPNSMVKTPYGDLIMHSRYQGQIYLRGLLLLNSRSSKRTRSRFAFSYNFIEGDTDRERNSLMDVSQELGLINKIWEYALKHSDPEAGVGTDKLQESFAELMIGTQGDMKDHADINVRLVKPSPEMINLSWNKMIQRATKPDQPRGFYYNQQEGFETISMIEDCLKMKATPLNKTLWDLLRKNTSIRTAEEELKHRFNRAQRTTIEETQFSNIIKRHVSAFLSDRDQIVEGATYDFINGENLGIGAVYLPGKNHFLIHDKWIRSKEAHEGVECQWERLKSEGKEEDKEGVFWCDHVLFDLHDILLGEMRPPKMSLKVFEQQKDQIRRQWVQKIHQMPRSVSVQRTTERGELEVSWETSDRSVEIKYSETSFAITLHRLDTCTRARSAKFYTDKTNGALQACRCPYKEVPLGTGSISFQELDPKKWYFPVISRKEAGALISIPPKPVKPLAVSETNPAGHTANTRNANTGLPKNFSRRTATTNRNPTFTMPVVEDPRVWNEGAFFIREQHPWKGGRLSMFDIHVATSGTGVEGFVAKLGSPDPTERKRKASALDQDTDDEDNDSEEDAAGRAL